MAKPGLGPIIIINGTMKGNNYAELIEQHVYPTLFAMLEDLDTRGVNRAGPNAGRAGPNLAGPGRTIL